MGLAKNSGVILSKIFKTGFVNLTNILMKKKLESSFWKIFIAALPIKVYITIPKI